MDTTIRIMVKCELYSKQEIQCYSIATTTARFCEVQTWLDIYVLNNNITGEE